MRSIVCAMLTALPLVAGCGSSSQPDDWIDVERADLILGIEVAGTLKAVHSDSLSPPALAEMWEVKIGRMAPEGSEIKKGAPALGFDTSTLEHSLEEKKNARDEATKHIEKTLNDAALARRDEELRISEADARVRRSSLKVDRPSDLIGSIELGTARLDHELAQKELAYELEKAAQAKERDDGDLAALRATRNHAESEIRQIEADIDRMLIVAPRDGTVIYVADWNDNKKKVGDSAYRGERVMEIAALGEMIGAGEVDEVDASKLALDQPVTLRLEAHPDVEYTGKIASMDPTVQRQSRNNPLKVVRVEISLDRSELAVRPGMRFRGSIEAGRIAKALLVPTESVFLTAEGPVAYRRSAAGFTAVPLKLGKRNRESVEVLEGLREGDRVSRRDLARSRSASR